MMVAPNHLQADHSRQNDRARGQQEAGWHEEESCTRDYYYFLSSTESTFDLEAAGLAAVRVIATVNMVLGCWN